MSEVDTITGVLAELVAAGIETWYRRGAVLSGRPTVDVRPWSILMRFPVTARQGRSFAVLAKIRRHPGMSVRQAICHDGLKREGLAVYEALRRLEHEVASSSVHCSVRALDYFAPWSALLMEELDSKQLRQRVISAGLVRSRRSRSLLEGVFEHAGSLLRLFHERVSAPSRGPIVSDDVSALVGEHLAFVGHGSADGELGYVRDVVGRVEVFDGESSIPYSGLHRDFNCSNIVVTEDDRVGLLDPRMTRGAVYHDLAKLMTDLQTFGIQGATRGRYLGATTGTLNRALVRGYFGDDRPDPIALRFYLLFSILEKWRYDVEGGGPAWARQPRRTARGRVASWRRDFFAGLVHRQARDLADSLSAAGA